MNYKIIEKSDLYFLGKTLNGITKDEFHEQVDDLWLDVFGGNKYELLKPYGIKNQKCSVIFDIKPYEEVQSYLVGVPSLKPVILDGYKTIKICNGRYVSFTLNSKNEKDINRFKKYIFTEWFLTKEYKLIPKTEIEIFNQDNIPYELLVSIELT